MLQYPKITVASVTAASDPFYELAMGVI